MLESPIYSTGLALKSIAERMCATGAESGQKAGHVFLIAHSFALDLVLGKVLQVNCHASAVRA